MSTVRVAYRRTFQDVPYWSQGVDITIEGASVDDVLREATDANFRKLAQVYKGMERTGNQLVVEAMGSDAPKGGSPR
jgi:hypothetical protein